MHDVIIGLIDDRVTVTDPTLEDTSNGLYALDVGATEYLDGETMYFGTAAGWVETQNEDVFVMEDEDDGSVTIDTESETVDERVTTEFYADPDAGFVGVSTSDGEFLFEGLELDRGWSIYQPRIDLDAFVEHVDRHNGHCWGYASSTEDHEDDIAGDANVNWHASASIEEAWSAEDLVQFAFSYQYGAGHVRGVVAESGYVAMYKDWPAEKFGRWLRDHVLPYAGLKAPTDEGQETLTSSSDEAAATGGDEA